jgi:uncharacterized protein YdeI (YjbR/CyaY-like superfamily)
MTKPSGNDNSPDDEREQVHAETAREWRRWLTTNHRRETGVWLVSWRNQTGRPRLTYEESVVEALAVGWIDSKALRLDDERTMLWFSPRKPGSGWSRANKERIDRLEREGRMMDAGREAIARAKQDGSWTLLDAIEDLIVPDDLAAAFASNPGSSEHWAGFPRSARRALLAWIVQARRPETRARRVSEVAMKAARGERANQPPTSTR